MKRYLSNTLFISICAVSIPALAFDLNDVSNTLNSAANTAKAVQDTQERFTDTDVTPIKSITIKKQKTKTMITMSITTTKAMIKNILRYHQAFKRKWLMAEACPQAGRKK
jgi:hypothetical protein